jgi:hypothetical protein
MATTTTNAEPTMTLTEAARKLRVTYQRAYNLLCAGQLDGRQVGGERYGALVVTRASVRRCWRLLNGSARS